MNESKLISGYKNRVEKFIYNMIQEPCKIGDSNNKKFSYRPNYTDTGKIKLKPFITDYNRVNNYLSNHMEDLKKYSPKKSKVLSGNTSESNINDNAFDQDLDISLSNFEEKIINKKYFYLQPVMNLLQEQNLKEYMILLIHIILEVLTKI